VVSLPAVALEAGRRLAFLRGFWQSWRTARQRFEHRRPDAVLAMGGFTSAPPVLAARSLGAKAFLHESNTVPGRANRWLARLVDRAFVGFPEAAARLAARATMLTGTPVRPQFQPRAAGACRVALGLDPARPVVLVTGGSQGASGLNELVLGALPLLARQAPEWQWLHLAGANDADRVKQAYAGLGLRAAVRPFLAEMELALGAATAGVCRAGASSLAELAAMRLPALLVPFPAAADNHQFHNARAFVDTGAAQLLEQRHATPQDTARRLRGLVEDASTRERMKLALARWHAPLAAEKIAGEIVTAVATGAKAQVADRRAGATTAPGVKPHAVLSQCLLAVSMLGLCANVAVS
jgi:UDP-N-acetylglucosamine--N-acetylmuramyl-(pentapeptide) pyrophosphoryl-undecaprenol N-acetylglucosamine transferase